MVTELTNCRVCGSTDLRTVVDLGNIFPSGFLKPGEVLPEEAKAPLVACKCEECGLVQLKHTVDLDQMYRQYWYSSSLNKSMVSSLHEIVEEVESRVCLTDEDYVVDIGANDGTMLQMYNHGVKVGFDPALNLHKPNCHTFINDYFTAEAYWKVTDKKAKVVTAIAVYYDLPSPLEFTKQVASILEDDGIFVIQFTDLRSTFELCAFDNICSEHLEIYTLQNVVDILNASGLRVMDVSYNTVNGGSVRVTAVHDGSSVPTKDVVVKTLADEFNYFSTHGFDYLNDRIKIVKEKTLSFISWAKKTNNVVHLLGASTKGNTYLQYCGISNKDIQFAAEVNPDKFGMRTAGSDIEIISEKDSLIKHPDYYLVPIWHFKTSILNNPSIRDYLNSGGHLVFPLPEFTVVSNTGEYRI